MIIIELIYNLAILVALSVFSGFVGARFKSTEIPGQVLQGILFGITAIIGMLYPFVLSEGIIFDGRSIVISLCTLFFGPLAGGIASGFAVVYRLQLGGGGMLMGLLVILSSYLIGYLFFIFKNKKTEKQFGFLHFYLFGLIVHTVMLATVFALPSESIQKAYQTIGITVIGIYPLITLIIGKILSDQEQRNELVKSLSKSEMKFRTLAETSPAAIFIYQDTKFIYVNHGSLVLTGYKKSELIGKDFWSVVHPEDQELVKIRGMKRQQGASLLNRYKFRIVKKNGDTRWVDFAASLIEIDGKPAAMGTAYDITEVIDSIEILQQQKDLFQTTLYSIGDAVITTDTKANIQQMNPVAQEILGLSEEEVIGKKVNEIFIISDEVTGETLEDPVQNILKAGKIVELSNYTVLKTKNGKTVPIADSGAPIKTKEGEIIGVVLVFRDQTKEREVENRILESEEKFRTLVEYAFDGIYMMDDKRYTYVNERFCEITGYSKEELTSEKFDFNILLTDYSKNVVEKRYFARKRGEDVPVTYGLQIKAKDGTIKETELSTASIGSLNHVGVIGIMRDITERKFAEKRLEESKERMQILVEGTPHLFFYVQDINKNIKYISPSVKKITGYSVEEWLGQKHWYMTDSPINKEVKRRTNAGFEGEINLDPIIGEIRHADGHNLFLEVYEKPIFEGEKVVGLQGVAHDVTKQRNAEEKLKEINKRLQIAIEGANIGIWDQDFTTGKVMRMGRWGEMLGYETEQITRTIKTWRELLHPDDVEMVEGYMNKHIEGNTNDFKVECRMRTSAGDYKWILNWGRIYERDEAGKPLRASGVHLDIDERKRAEIELNKAKLLAEKANKLKSEFLAQISHEIRSPLNAVVNFSQLLKEEFGDSQNEEVTMSFSGIESASRRVIRTVDLILNMSELQLGTYEVVKRKINLVESLSILQKEYSNLARSKSLELKFVTELERAYILSDEYAVNQIFANLVDNAIKYTKEGYVEIQLTQANEMLQVKVRDTGVGISKEFIPEIFESFSQEEKGYSRTYEGSGLGLSLVKKYCDLINAEIEIESERGEGATITITLPERI